MDQTIDLQDFSRKNVYEMVETTAYFEAYSPILEGLQQTEANDLPFQVGSNNIETQRSVDTSYFSLRPFPFDRCERVDECTECVLPIASSPEHS